MSAVERDARSARERQRDLDISYVVGERIKNGQFRESGPSQDELALLHEVWERAYQMGIWRGLDLTTERVHNALSLAAHDAGAP